MAEFEGKVALITGGTRGLGRAIALRLARGGATLALNYRRDEDGAARTLNDVQAFSPSSILVKAEMEEDVQVRAMVARAATDFGRLDILVVNSTATAFKPLLGPKPRNRARTLAV